MNLGYLGIDEEFINEWVDSCEKVCDEYELDKQELYQRAMSTLEKYFKFKDISNSIVLAHFIALRVMLMSKKGLSYEEIDVYVNGKDDTYLKVKGVEY